MIAVLTLNTALLTWAAAHVQHGKPPLMEARSPTLPEALASGKPTLVEFYAPWCIECRESAPSMVRLEKRFGDKVNFVTLNGDDPSNAQFVRLFGVDGIPHLALIGSDRKLKATLIGAAPESVVESSLDALWRGNPMPYGAGSGT